MNKTKSLSTTIKAVAFVGIFSLMASAQAAFVAVPFPSPEGAVSLGGLTAIPAGTVLASQSQSYTDPFGFSGTLNSFVVRPGAVGTPLDFYYQLVNTTGAPDVFGDEQIARLSIQGGFPTTTVDPVNSVAQTTTNPSTLAVGAGLKPASTADRGEPLITSGNLGFNFPAGVNTFTSNAANVASGQSSTFLVVRSTSTSFAAATARVGVNSGFSTVGTFAAVPEPSSILFGLGMFGVALTSRAKRRASK